MLFNLTRCITFPSQKTGKDIFCHYNWGPAFRGENGSELSAPNEPLNGFEQCKSCTNYSSFGIKLDDDGLNMLTRQRKDEFTITELEVWKVEEKP